MFNIFLPIHPQKLPPIANVVKINANCIQLTFHFSFNLKKILLKIYFFEFCKLSASLVILGFFLD